MTARNIPVTHCSPQRTIVEGDAIPAFTHAENPRIDFIVQATSTRPPKDDMKKFVWEAVEWDKVIVIATKAGENRAERIADLQLYLLHLLEFVRKSCREMFARKEFLARYASGI